MTTEPNRATWLQGPATACTPLPRKIEPAWRLVLLGAPGVGKGTQAQLLHQRLGACHLSTGDVFRAAATRSDCSPSPAMAAALQFMQRGLLVPDPPVWDMVKERVGCLRCAGGFLLDGFPRTLSQAESLHRLLAEEHLPLQAVVNYDLPTPEIISRLSGRRTCAKCKSVYHVTSQPPTRSGICDKCGSALFRRDDDRPEAIQVRLEAYQQSTAPLIDFYQGLGLLLTIPATGSPDEICHRTVIALNLENQFPAHS